MPEVRNRSGVPHRYYDYARKAYIVWAPGEIRDVPHAVAQQVRQAHPSKMELVLPTPEPEPEEGPRRGSRRGLRRLYREGRGPRPAGRQQTVY